LKSSNAGTCEEKEGKIVAPPMGKDHSGQKNKGNNINPFARPAKSSEKNGHQRHHIVFLATMKNRH